MNAADVARWLYTPRRLGLLVLVVVLLLVLLVVLQDDEEAGRTVHTDPAPSASPPSSAPPSSSAPTRGDAKDAAALWVKRWASGGDTETWLQQLEDLTDPELLRRLSVTDPEGIPANRVTGSPRLTDTVGTNSTQVAVDTDAGLVSVSLRRDGDRWLVTDVQPGAQPEEG